jgi:hypothetical protein
MSFSPSVSHFFDRFPAAQEAYAEAPLYHLTHSRYLGGIQANGLQANRTLFPEEHGAFLLEMYQRYGSNHPSDAAYIRDRILDPSNVYLSTARPDMNGYLSYGVPERLVFLMRGMKALAAKTSLSSGERDFAAHALEEHREALTADEPSIVALEINPLSPSVVNNRLGRMALDKVSDMETALQVARYVDGSYANNIPIREGDIDPEFITVFGETPFDPESALVGVDAEPGWAFSIR